MPGQCNICGWKGKFLRQDFEREGTVCGNCSATSRHRAVIRGLGVLMGRSAIPLFAWPREKSARILESSARGSYPVMLADKFDYYATEFDPDRIAEGKRPREFADFHRLHYDEGTFDFVIASDVFEHIRRDKEAFAELRRVLKSGGSLVLTVPYDHARSATVQRVDTSGDRDVQLLEPEFHGGGGHTLTYRNYGRDLMSMMRDAGFSVVRLQLDDPGSGITPQSVFLASKGEYVDVSVDARTPENGGRLGFLLPYRLFLLFKYNLRGFVHYWDEAKRKSGG